jgi:hypothetical protein
MNKKIYISIIFLLTFIFIYFNFFFLERKISLLNNTSRCLLIYNVKSYDILCNSFNDFYHFYLENSKDLLYKKIKVIFIREKIKFQIF